MSLFVQEATLVFGPQDGARIRAVNGELPQTVYVESVWQITKFSAWSRHNCKRFSVCYVIDHSKDKDGKYFYLHKRE